MTTAEVDQAQLEKAVAKIMMPDAIGAWWAAYHDAKPESKKTMAEVALYSASSTKARYR